VRRQRWLAVSATDWPMFCGGCPTKECAPMRRPSQWASRPPQRCPKSHGLSPNLQTLPTIVATCCQSPSIAAATASKTPSADNPPTTEASHKTSRTSSHHVVGMTHLHLCTHAHSARSPAPVCDMEPIKRAQISAHRCLKSIDPTVLWVHRRWISKSLLRPKAWQFVGYGKASL
jgi:hypothetical protein